MRTSPSGLVDLGGRAGRILRTVQGACTWCGQIVEGRRRTWCSDECVDAFWWTQPQGQRTRIFKRDRGICADCGVDTKRLERISSRIRHMVRAEHSVLPGAGRWGVARLSEARAAGLLPTEIQEHGVGRRFLDALERELWARVGRKPPPRHRASGDLWDLDHIVPIADGGDPHDPENMQTLCWWCHKATTAREATERAERRRAAQEGRAES